MRTDLVPISARIMAKAGHMEQRAWKMGARGVSLVEGADSVPYPEYREMCDLLALVETGDVSPPIRPDGFAPTLAGLERIAERMSREHSRIFFDEPEENLVPWHSQCQEDRDAWILIALHAMDLWKQEVMIDSDRSDLPEDDHPADAS